MPSVIDDPHKVVKVVASDGKSGETRELSYSNCKVIGNGSFGVVFQAKLFGAPKDKEDIAIKKVLQDKRFKVRPPSRRSYLIPRLTDGSSGYLEPRTPNYATRSTSKRL